MRIAPLDFASDAAVADWHAVYASGLSHGREDPPMWTLPEMLVAYRYPDHTERRVVFVAVDDEGRTLGAADISLPLLDNPTLATFDLIVHPEYRRRGIGAALLEHTEQWVRAEGRTSVLSELDAPAVDPDSSPYVRFARRHGYTCRLVEIRRMLELPVPAERMAQLRRHANERAGGYELASWAGACPDQYADAYAQLKGLLSVEAPMGELDYEQEKWDVKRLRSDEERALAQGRTLYTSIALAPDGEIAGHTQIAVPRHDPGRAYQWDTLVRTVHRGHRLGLALKVANLAAMTAAHPEITRINTWNAEVNGPMIAVNEALGFRKIEELQEWQRDL